MVKVRKDLTGLKFGHLTVLRQAEDYITPKGLHIAMWTVICDCGESDEFNTQGGALTSGRTISCGCHLRNKLKRYNTYDLTGDYGIGYTSKGEEFWFDLEDYDKIKDYCWYYSRGYVKAHELRNSRKIISLHNLVMDINGNVNWNTIVDHIYHPNINENKYDNRKQNLRIITQGQNCMNQYAKSTNKSGVKGVNWAKDKDKWQAKITVNYKQMHLGFYDDIEDAIKARKEAEERYFKGYNIDTNKIDSSHLNNFKNI